MLALPNPHADARPRLEEALGAKHFHGFAQRCSANAQTCRQIVFARQHVPRLVARAKNPRADGAHHRVVDSPPLAGRPWDNGSSPASSGDGDGSVVVPSSISSRLLLGDDHRRDQENALRHHLVKRRDAGQDQPVVQYADNEDAEQPADDGPLAAG